MRIDSSSANHAFEDLDGCVERVVPCASAWSARRGAQQRMARLEGQTFIELIARQLDLIPIVVDTGAVVCKESARWRGSV